MPPFGGNQGGVSKPDDQNNDQQQSTSDQTNSTTAPSSVAPASFGLFGTTQPASNTTTSTFGSSTPTTFGSSFGGQSQSAFGSSTPTTGFGSSTSAAPSSTTTGLFGSTTPATTGGMFGSSTQSTGGLFGSSTTGSGFGSSTGFGQSQSGGLFGSAQPSSTSTGLFGSSNQATTGGLFGSTTPATTGGLFSSRTTPSFGASSSGNSSGFGQSTASGFGATTSSGWGSASSQPSTGFGSSSTTTQGTGFGQSTTGGFGATTSSGWGSAPTQPSTSFGGGQSSTGGFGSSTPSSGFGWGSSTTSTQPTTSGFNWGSSTSAASSFGQATASTPSNFGQSSTGGFGPSSGFNWGSSTSGGFGQPATTSGGFGARGFGTGGFGQATTQQTGGFGQPATTGGFGATTSTQPAGPNPWSHSTTGTGNPSYQATPDSESGSNIRLHSVTAMPQFNTRSFEELRHEDYQANKQHTPGSSRPGTTFGAQANTTTGRLFGSGPAASTSTFGQSTSSSSTLPAWFGSTPQASEASSHMFPTFTKEWSNLASLFKISNAPLFYPHFHNTEVPEEEAQVDLEDQFVDVQFVLEEGTINAHQAVIAANSSYFRKYFRRCRKAKNQKETENDNSNNDTEELSHSFENDILRVDAKKLNLGAFLEVVASCYSISATTQGTHDKLLIMLDIIEKYGFFMNRSVLLDKLEALVSADNVVEILKKTLELENQDITKDSVQRLKKKCSVTVLKNFAALSQTEEFKNLSKEILMDIVILSADKLNIS